MSEVKEYVCLTFLTTHAYLHLNINKYLNSIHMLHCKNEKYKGYTRI